jgi:hypothetical protein
VYSQVWQYKRLFGEVDKNNPLTPAELKQKERIWQNNDGKNPIKAAMIDTESFLKLDFNETSSSESEVQGKIESDNWQTELEKNKEKENSGIKELSIEEYNQKYKKLIDYIMEKNFINKWNDFEWLFEWLQFSIEKNINKGTSWTAFYRVYINDWKQKIALWLRQGNTKWQVFENNFSPKLYENNNWFGVVEVVKWVEGSDLLTLVENNPTIAKEYAQAVWELLIEIEKKWYWLNDIWFKDGHNVMYDPETKIIKLIEPLNITNRRNNLFSHESSLIDQLLQNEFWTGGWMDISISAKGTFLFYLLKTLIDKKWYDIISNMDQPNKKAYKWTLEFQINDMMWFEYLPIQRDIEWEYVVLKWQTNKIDERVIEAIKNNDINEFKKIYENNKIVLTWNTTNTIEVHHNDYFWKESRFWFDSKQARDHSAFMDQFTTQTTAEQIAQIREKIQAVAQMYTDKTGKAFTLTDAQIQAIIATHLKPGELGKLTQAELRAKVQELATAISDTDVRRFLLEAGFCGMKEFAVNAVNRIKSRKEKRTPMRAVLALNALIMLNSVDNVKTKILHKSIDVTQHMYTSLEKQSRDIQAVEQWFTKKIEQSKEQFDEMVSTYKNFLETVKHYNNTWLWQWINRISNGAIDETIAKAEEWKYALENTQNIVWDVNTMMQEIKTRTDASLQIAENMKNALNNAHDITDLTLNILQIISLITLLYQVFYAYGLYHSKEWKVKEQQVMMKNMKIGIVASAISLLAFYGKINPEMQSWSNEVTQQLQTLDDMIVVANSDAQNISNNQANDNYFWKESRFWFDSKQARDHSVFMDQFTGQARPEQITQIREKIQVVAQIYTDKTGKTLELTDAQIQTIIATHLKPGELGKLTQAELKVKVQELATAIPDADVRRFLLEAGFCGIWWKFQENIKTIFTNWILKSNEKVNYSNVSPDLINDYSQYHESVGVEEGYTLLEHTNMVLGQFDKYFWERFDFGVVTKNYFRDLLMIHDIWKPIAHKIWNKDDQHIYSKPLIEKILIDKWYTKNLVNFGVDLMTMDPIGWYLQWKYTLDESINIIKETYSKSWNLLSIDKYFDLLKIYYLSDTSSYTTDANWISSLDHLFDFNSWLLLNNSLQSKVDIMKNKLIWDVIWNNILNVQDRNLNLLEESEKITDMISFKSFFEKLSFEGKKSLLMDYLAKLPPIYSKEINILDISDKNCAKGWLLLYCWDRSHHMNERLEISSFGRNEVFGFLWRYFLEYWLKHNLYVTYNHNKNLYRDIIIDPDKQSDLLEEILWLHAWGIYMDKGLFSTTLKPHSTFSEEYYNEERWKWLEYFKEKAIQKVELRYQNDQLEEISNKVKKENGEAIFELDLLWDNMTSDQRRTSSLQKIHSGEFIKEVKNYAVRFIVVNSKGWIDIENNIQTVHSDKENEILFWPNKVWKVLKSKFDTKKKKILIFIDGS